MNSRAARNGLLGLLAAADAYQPSPAERRALATLRKRTGPLSDAMNELARQIVTGIPDQAPVVLPIDADPGFRVGWLLPFTDLDAFLVALLGEPVPTSPRWMREPLVVGGELLAKTADEALAQLGMPLNQCREIAAKRKQPPEVRRLLLEDLMWVGERLELDATDPVLFDLFDAAVDGGQMRVHPFLRHLDQIARRAPHYRHPAYLTNFRPVHVVLDAEAPGSPFARGAFVIWHPGVSRAGLAARLRFVFARVLAPWSTSPSLADRKARYAAYLGRLGTPRASMGLVADLLRREPPWAAMEPSALLRRLEHWSAEAALWARQRPPIG